MRRPDNFAIDGRTLPPTTSITYDPAQAVAVIQLPAGGIPPGANATLTVRRVASSLGFAIEPVLRYPAGVRYCSLWPRGWGHLFTGGLSTRGDFDDPRDAAPAWALAASVLPWAFDPEFARVRLAPACVEAR